MSRHRALNIVVGVCVASTIVIAQGQPASPPIANPLLPNAQLEISTVQTSAAVPPFLPMTGVLVDASAIPLAGPVEITLAIYSDREGGPALWTEVQTVHTDQRGQYSVTLGATTSSGLPANIFAAGGVRWLGVSPAGEHELARTPILSVPYALKAGDAETLGGKPASAFMAATGHEAREAAGSTEISAAAAPVPPGPQAQVFTATANPGPGFISQATSGPPLQVSSSAAVANLNADLVDGFHAAAFPKLAIANTFAATQTIDTGNLDLDPSTATAGNITKNGTPFLHDFGTDNVFIGKNAGNFGMTGGQNTAAGSGTLLFNTTGGRNTATGRIALFVNTTGSNNTASGDGALSGNTTGQANVAVGFAAGSLATTGSNNIYLGADVGGVAGESNTMYLGRQGTQNKTVIAGIRGTSVTGGEPVVIDANGRLGTGAITPGANSVGSAQVIDESLTASDLAPNSVTGSELAADSVTADKVAFSYAASATEGGAATDVACLGCVSANEVNFSFATLGVNTFTATQTIDTGNLDLDSSSGTTGNITKNGVPFLHDFGTRNTFVGMNAGNVTMTGSGNTASGAQALFSNTTGLNNTASGDRALTSNTTGWGNTAVGNEALDSNMIGTENTAVGLRALGTLNGYFNTAVGSEALTNNATAQSNTALGHRALFNTSSPFNTAVGAHAGILNTTGCCNIYLGASVEGVAGEVGTMYLGQRGTQTTTYIAGVRGTIVTGGEAVVIDANGRLGSGAVAPGASTVGSNEVIDDSLTASDLAPNSVTSSELAANSVIAAKVEFNYAASATEGGAATDVACLGCVSANEVNFSFATLGVNTFTATQTIDTGNLDLDPSTATAGNITKNGTRFLHNFGTNNTFLGVQTGNLTMTGIGGNVAIGNNALSSNTSGNQNTAVGGVALGANTGGTDNTASGSGALMGNTMGSGNTASGQAALLNNTIGNFNVAIGLNAGFNATGSNNIYLGTGVVGVASQSNTMYLGNQGVHDKTFIAGVRGITTVNPDAISIMIDSAGQLGTVSSSRHFKEDIRDMADASRRLLQLRPVTFRYKQTFGDGSKPIQYGLIAEEVAEVFPELAVRNAAGDVETVHYETLNVLLLNELQKQQQKVQRQEGELRQQRQDLQTQRERIETLEQRLNELLGSARANVVKP